MPSHAHQGLLQVNSARVFSKTNLRLPRVVQVLCTIDGQIDPTVNLIVVFPSVCNKMSDLATSSPHVGMMWNGAAKLYQASLCQIKALIWLGGSGII